MYAINKFYPHLDLRLIFTNRFSLRSLFNFKDKRDPSLCSEIMFSFSCQGCNNLLYNGSTIRQLYVLSSEHRGISPRSSLPYNTQNKSAIFKHHCNTSHPISNSDFKILSKNKFFLHQIIRIIIYTSI